MAGCGSPDLRFAGQVSRPAMAKDGGEKTRILAAFDLMRDRTDGHPAPSGSHFLASGPAPLTSSSSSSRTPSSVGIARDSVLLGSTGRDRRALSGSSNAATLAVSLLARGAVPVGSLRWQATRQRTIAVPGSALPVSSRPAESWSTAFADSGIPGENSMG